MFENESPETGPHNPPNVSPLDVLADYRRAASAIAEAAEQMLTAIRDNPKVRVEVGGFYATYDGSLVYVARTAGKCRCPICTGQLRTVRIGPLQFFQPVPPDEQAAHKAEDGPDRYAVVVLRGGAGVHGLPGEEPGELYGVDAAGMVVGLSAVDAAVPTLGQGILSLIGLSLRRRVNVEVVR